jgi:hypothetical protein
MGTAFLIVIILAALPKPFSDIQQIGSGRRMYVDVDCVLLLKSRMNMSPMHFVADAIPDAISIISFYKSFSRSNLMHLNHGH